VDLFNYTRRASSEVQVGDTPLGAGHPVRLQSMTNTSTMDTQACVEQTLRIVQAGGEYVRLTTQGMREARNLENICRELRSRDCRVPLVADVHFNADVADVAACYAQKVRINPGNYVDGVHTFQHFSYTDEEYAAEIDKIRRKLVPFLQICKEHHTAVRIGVNHGSLSDRIMSRYGDTPRGMVESCMEFLRICVAEQFYNVVISIKASNTIVMVRTVRLLVQCMANEGMSFPLHLGVTEAGEGEDGRVKSAVGIGALLADGIGDTIRVSLSEAPEAEIPVAKKLRDYVVQRAGHAPIKAEACETFDYLAPVRRHTHAVGCIGGDNVPVVIGLAGEGDPAFVPDFLYVGNQLPKENNGSPSYIADAAVWNGQGRVYPAYTTEQLDEMGRADAPLKFLRLSYPALRTEVLDCLRAHPEVVVLAESTHANRPGELRAVAHTLMRAGLTNPLVFALQYNEDDPEDLQIKAAADLGVLLIDGLADGIFLGNAGRVAQGRVHALAYNILQATRTRVSKTEYISCPGCGRTLYDLQSTIARVKAATAHLKGLKIAVMGCIVNGPGEMADADYGYVGAGRGRISLYKKKECVARNLPEEEAVEHLLALIKANGDDPS